MVLTDRQMPTMGGEELARLLKARSPQTPVIMVTGVPPAEGCADVDAIVVKPFSLGTIMEAIGGCCHAAGENATIPAAAKRGTPGAATGLGGASLSSRRASRSHQ